jgi:hypothetical protein
MILHTSHRLTPVRRGFEPAGEPLLFAIKEMSSLLRRITDASSEWLKGNPSTLTVSKKFEINSTETPDQNNSRRRGKTFSITSERSGGIAGGVSEGRFGISAETRPKQCPRCRTQNSVTRGSEQRWKCKQCDFHWG